MTFHKESNKGHKINAYLMFEEIKLNIYKMAEIARTQEDV